jgi:hypothetical protein
VASASSTWSASLASASASALASTRGYQGHQSQFLVRSEKVHRITANRAAAKLSCTYESTEGPLNVRLHIVGSALR